MGERGSFRIATIAGIPVRVHFSLVILVPLLALSFAAQLRAAAEQGAVPPFDGQIGLIAWGTMAALFLLVAVVLHELGHALVARRFGGRTKSITLWALGGVAQIEDGPIRPRHEALMAAAGPLVSGAIAATCLAGASVLGTVRSPHLSLALTQLGIVNAALAVFNLLPAFPMDGGRVLRSAVAWRTGEPRATVIAAKVGKVFAALFALLGFASGNLILVLIALFVYSAGAAEQQMAVSRAALGGFTASQFMSARPETIPASASVEEAVAQLISRRRLAAPVVDAGGRLVGMLGPAQVEKVPAEDRTRLTAGEIAARNAPTAAPGDPLSEVLSRMDKARLHGLPVMDGERVAGVIDREDLGRALRLAEARSKVRPGPRPSS